MRDGWTYAVPLEPSRPRKDRLSPRHLQDVKALLREVGLSGRSVATPCPTPRTVPVAVATEAP